MALDLDNLSKALAALGSLVGLAGKANTVEYNRNVIEMQQALIATQRDMQALMDENTRLHSELAGLQSRIFHHSVEWKRNVDGQEDGPFCPICRADGQDMPLRFRGAHNTNAELAIFSCPKEHKAPGRGWEITYEIPKRLVRIGRYQGKELT